MKRISNSQLSCFRSCPRKHFHRYVQLRRTLKVAENLTFGRNWHAMLETKHRFGMDLVLDDYIGPHTLAKLRAMYIAYCERWAGEGFKYIDVELEFEVPLRNPQTGRKSKTYSLCGKIDAVVQSPAGDVSILEHKTTSMDIGLGAPYWGVLTMNSQIGLYYFAAKQCGHDVQSIIYDAARKPAHRPRANGEEDPEEYQARMMMAIADDPDRYFRRNEIRYLGDEHADTMADIWATARMMRECELAKRWPRNPDACMTWGRPCEYFEVCVGRAAIDDEMLFRTSDREHEELSR